MVVIAIFLPGELARARTHRRPTKLSKAAADFNASANSNAKPPIPAAQLDTLRRRVADLEQSLLDGVRLQSNIRSQVKKIKELQKLQILERDLGKKAAD